MKILVIGAGVIGTVYAWQLSLAGQEVSLLVRPGRKEAAKKNGLHIRYADERETPKKKGDVIFRPEVVTDWSSQDGYDLVIVSVGAHQLSALLPQIAERCANSDVLFFGNVWNGDEQIKQYLPASTYLFGFSKLVAGWRSEARVDCIIFDSPTMSTVLGEADGRQTPRLRALVRLFREANLKPETPPDIRGWLAAHYVEYLGAVGGILEAGSTAKFAADKDLVRAALIATREGLDVCRARGIDVRRAAPPNLQLLSLPLWLLTPLAQMNYGMSTVQRFPDEDVANCMDELRHQYGEVLAEGRRLGVQMPYLESFERAYAQPSRTSAQAGDCPLQRQTV